MEKYLEHFDKLVKSQRKRLEKMKSEKEFIDYSKLDKIIIGIIGGDGIGVTITKSAKTILKFLLKDEIKSGRVELRDIDGLTIENRCKQSKSVPDDVLEDIKKCHVLLKGPTTTPRKGDDCPNIESANVAIRKELDLFANVRPVCIKEKNIDWTFFRENTEGAYVLGSDGIDLGDGLSFDFKVITDEGARRIAKMAFEFAKKNGKRRVTCVTKANVVKTTDGKFLEVCAEVAKDYKDIQFDDWYIDIMTAKLIDENRCSDFSVFVLPNLYGDILTDEAAQIQGGVGTAGSANIGKRYAMFEAIHGSAPRMVKEGRDKYADPSSIIKAAAMLLSHIGYVDKANKLEKAIWKCEEDEAVVITGRSDGATSEQYANYIISTIEKL